MTRLGLLPDLGANTDAYVVRWTERGYSPRGQVFGGQSGLWTLTLSVRTNIGRMVAETVTRCSDSAVLYDLATGLDLLPVCPWCGPICESQYSHLDRIRGAQ
jgi:hypothetical protein